MTRLALLLSILAAAGLLAWAGGRYYDSRTNARTALAAYQAVADRSVELSRLRAAAPPEARRARPAPGIAARVAEVVAASGLPQSALQNVTPEAESPVAGGASVSYRRMAVRLMLDPVTLPQLGTFLQEWRTAEPAWTVSSLDLAPSNQAMQGPHRPIRAAMVIETVFAQSTEHGGKN